MATPTEHWIPAFLEALRTQGVVSAAARAVGISPSTVHTRRRNDADFAAAFDDAMEEAVDMAEAEAWRRAVTGYDKPVIHQGEITDTYRVHSDELLKFILQGRRKHVFAQRTELTGADGGPVALQDDQARAARVAQLLALAQERAAQAAEQNDEDDLF